MSPWVKLSDNFDDDHRIAAVGAAGAGLLVMLLAYSNRTLSDGWISANTLRSKSAVVADAEQVIALMLRTGLLRADERDGLPGFRIAEDFVREQWSKEKVEAQRAEWKKRTAKMRDAMTKPKSGLRAI